jgi:uncharacterized membrane protein YfcA
MLTALIFIAGLWAGLQNALAGGGSFVTLPVLIFSGMSPLAANITSTVALFPGQVTSGLAGRSLVSGAGRLPFWGLFALSILGGALGGLLLLNTPSAVCHPRSRSRRAGRRRTRAPGRGRRGGRASAPPR